MRFSLRCPCESDGRAAEISVGQELHRVLLDSIACEDELVEASCDLDHVVPIRVLDLEELFWRVRGLLASLLSVSGAEREEDQGGGAGLLGPLAPGSGGR